MVYVSNTATGKNWEYILDRKKIFEATSVRSVQLTDRANLGQGSESREMMDDDRGLFDSYYSLALSDLIMIMARNFAREFSDYNTDGDKTHITLSMPDVHNHGMAHVLETHITEYIILKCLNEWFGLEGQQLGLPQAIYEIEGVIRSAMRFRKKPASLPVNPVL